ncbi:hypothetical protein ACS0TY_030358 [Phlomoides rotata]
MSLPLTGDHSKLATTWKGDNVGQRFYGCEKFIPWEEKSAEEYGSREVKILFTAVYNTVNNLAEKIHIEQGRCVKPLLVKLWVEILTSFKKELDSWTKETTLTLDGYLSSSWVSIGYRICIINSLQFLGMKLSEEMLSSQECLDLCPAYFISGSPAQ